MDNYHMCYYNTSTTKHCQPVSSQNMVIEVLKTIRCITIAQVKTQFNESITLVFKILG